MSLTRRLLLSYFAIIAVTGVVLTVAADRMLRSRLTEEAVLILEREARYFAALADHAGAGALDSLVHALRAVTDRRLTVVDRSGAVIADSEFRLDQLATLENHATRPEIRTALEGGVGTDLRVSASTGQAELKVAVPYRAGVVRVSTELPRVNAVVDRAQGAVLLGAIIAVLGAAVLAVGFAGNVARPLVRLRDAAQAIARGERPHLDTRGRSEVGDLARALRNLDESLGSRLADLERERSEMAALIGAMVEGVVACDARGVVTTMNPAARRFLGLGAQEPAPPAGELFRHRAAREAVEAALTRTATEGIGVEVNGRDVLLSAHPLPGGGALLVLHDVTALRRLETVRRDFVANVSHELKTPLTVLRGYAETLQQDDPPPDVRREFVAAMLANARRMQRLIDDLLDLSRIESGAWAPQPQPVALTPLAQETWQSLGGSGNAAALAFAVHVASGADEVMADPEALRQILGNVLDNAARYTPPGGRVEVRAERSTDGFRLDVVDTGPGIASEHLPRVFERFYRVDPARSRELGGTGLGLSIVKHLVEAQGGRVEALSALGQGTTIRITLPATISHR